MMKNIFLFAFFVILGLGSIIVMYLMRSSPQVDESHVSLSSQQTIPTPTLFSTKLAPSESLRGTLTVLSNDVLWESREATEPAKITSSTEIQQGEKIVTGNTGKATITFQLSAILNLSPQTDVNIIQTLPNSLVILQNSGSVEYTRQASQPLSVRAYHLLIDQELGSVVVTMGKNDSLVSVLVKQGKVTVAYNDLDLLSNVTTISAGQTLVFDDTTRTTILK